MTYPFPNPQNYQTVEVPFLKVMASTVRIYKWLSTDGYGEDTWETTPLESPAYVEDSDEGFVNATGGTFLSTGVAYLGFILPGIGPKDLIEVLDWEGNWDKGQVGGVKALMGPDGIHHQEVYYGPRGHAGVGIGEG